MDLAPIVLFVYNRPANTLRTLEELAKNDLADQSRLYIFSDGPRQGASPEDIKAIDAVREVIRRERWCKEVTIKEQAENLGLAENIRRGVDQVINQHGRVIVLEDDLLTSPGFLRFMNEALNIYENEAKVFGVTGFKAPSHRPESANTFFLPVMSSWSWGTWLDRWQTVDFDGKRLLKTINERNRQSEMDLNGYAFYRMLQNQVAGKINSWAIRFYASMFLQRRWFLYPSYSLVQNIGFGGRATHVGARHFLARVERERDYLEVDQPSLEIDPKVAASFRLQHPYWKRKIIQLQKMLGI